MLWDASADDLILGGAAGLSVNSAALVTGVLTTTAATVFNGGFASNAASSFGADIDLLQGNHIRFKHAAGGTIRASISAESDDDLQFNTGSSETARMTIDTNGNVGIGTSSITNVSNYKFLATNGASGGGLLCQQGGANKFAVYNANNDGYYDATSNHVFRTGGAISGTERMRIDSTGAVTIPSQPAFSATKSSKQSNVAINSQVTVVFDTEVFDQNADFSSNTFTAPVTGKYQLNLSLYTNEIDSAADYYMAVIKTSNREYQNVIDPGVLASDPVYWNQGVSVLADMDANDTAYVFIQQGNGNQQTDVATPSFFSGYLVA
jgi:hypothetical protein